MSRSPQLRQAVALASFAAWHSVHRMRFTSATQRPVESPPSAPETALDVEAELDFTRVEAGALERAGRVLIDRGALAVGQEQLEPVAADGALDADGPAEVAVGLVGKVAVGRDDLHDQRER